MEIVYLYWSIDVSLPQTFTKRRWFQNYKRMADFLTASMQYSIRRFIMISQPQHMHLLQAFSKIWQDILRGHISDRYNSNSHLVTLISYDFISFRSPHINSKTLSKGSFWQSK